MQYACLKQERQLLSILIEGLGVQVKPEAVEQAQTLVQDRGLSMCNAQCRAAAIMKVTPANIRIF